MNPASPRSVSAASQTAAPRAASQLEQHNSTLRSEIEGLSSDIANLNDRLARVLRSETPCDTGKCSPEEMLVPAAEEARGMTKTVSALRFRIRDITDRLEA